MAKKEPIKMRNFELCMRIDDDFNEVEFKKKAKTLGGMKAWAYCIHDKDIKEDGTPKLKHVHLFVQMNNSSTVASYAKHFGVEPQYIEKLKDRSYFRACRYLAHLNAPEKYQYPIEAVQASFNYREKMMKDMMQTDLEQKKNELVKDILNGAVKRYNLFPHLIGLGLDDTFLVKWKRDIDNAFKVRTEKLALNNNREMEVIFIHGSSGIGKTTLAKHLAEQRNMKAFITGSHNDIFDGYADEECVVIDDVRKNTFENYADVLRLLDPFTSSRYRSRYCNKVVLADMMILTSSHSLDSVFNNSCEESKQIKRRIPTVIELTKEMAIVKSYNESLNDYVESFRFKNPLSNYIESLNKPKKIDSVSWLKKTFLSE